MLLLIDGLRYHAHRYENESELEKHFEAHVKDVFGEESVYFGKKKISSLAGIGTIPDGYAVTLVDQPHWYIVEIELSSHPLFDHIVAQIVKFNNGLKNLESRQQLAYFMHKEIETQPVIKNLIKDRFGEVFKFLSDLVKSYTILIVLDKKPKELDEVVASLPVETRVIEFKTFEADGNDIPSHAHEFETLFGVLPRPLVEKGIWIPAIVEAFHRLGGPGKFYHRKEIFEMVVKVKSELRNRGRTPDKTLDFYLGTNSRGKRKDLFEPKKEGSGYWMLKRMIRTP